MRTLWLVLFAFAVNGCGMKEKVGNLFADEDNASPPTPLTEITPTTRIERMWSRGIGAGTDELFVELRPTIDGATVYCAERKGKVTAVDIEQGRTVWSTDTDAPLAGGPGVGDGLVLVGTSKGEVIALDAAEGKERWRAQVSSEVLAAPRSSDGIVVARTGDGKLFGLRAATGERIWVYDRTVPVLSLRGTSPPVLVDDMVLTGFDNGRLVALELRTGRLLWETQIAVPRGRSDLERMVDIDAEPVVYGRSVYVATFQGRVASLALATGEIEWARDISSAAGLAVDVTRMYVTDENGVIWALDRRNGTSLWKQENLKYRLLTAPAIVTDYVVVGDVEGYLHWLQETDGDFAARVRTDKSKIIAPPVVSDHRLIAYTSDGELAAYKPY
ncbi:MAG: outer membrane protein assembly factor BamB [Gammaproteobacteria bacterium]|nr:outer membrane protein assembly factor BamB [Gammaproteobacteria bacterium]